MGVFDVPAAMLIEEVARDLREEKKVEKPEFADWVKTGAHRERQPQREDWWHIRTASVLYRIFKDGPVGVESLRTYYGGRRNRGVRKHRFRKASGKVLRLAVQRLEQLGLVEKATKGRRISPKGHSYLNRMAKVAYTKFEEKRRKQEELFKAERARIEALARRAAERKKEEKEARGKGVGKKLGKAEKKGREKKTGGKPKPLGEEQPKKTEKGPEGGSPAERPSKEKKEQKETPAPEEEAGERPEKRKEKGK